MSKFVWVLVIGACLASGCVSSFVRDSDKLQSAGSGEVQELELVSGEKDVTPRHIAIERVFKADGVTLDHVRLIADVSKTTVFALWTPEDSPQRGRRRVIIQREKHGVFIIPAKYLLDYDLTHGSFVDPWDWQHPLTPTHWAEVTDNPSADWHGVACVLNKEGEGRCLCLIDALPAGPRREEHRGHTIGALVEPPAATQRTLAAK